MIPTNCPRQKAFMQQLNILLCAKDLPHFSTLYIDFVNLWCPTLKEVEGNNE